MVDSVWSNERSYIVDNFGLMVTPQAFKHYISSVSIGLLGQ